MLQPGRRPYRNLRASADNNRGYSRKGDISIPILQRNCKRWRRVAKRSSFAALEQWWGRAAAKGHWISSREHCQQLANNIRHSKSIAFAGSRAYLKSFGNPRHTFKGFEQYASSLASMLAKILTRSSWTSYFVASFSSTSGGRSFGQR